MPDIILTNKQIVSICYGQYTYRREITALREKVAEQEATIIQQIRRASKAEGERDFAAAACKTNYRDLKKAEAQLRTARETTT